MAREGGQEVQEETLDSRMSECCSKYEGMAVGPVFGPQEHRGREETLERLCNCFHYASVTVSGHQMEQTLPHQCSHYRKPHSQSQLQLKRTTCTGELNSERTQTHKRYSRSSPAWPITRLTLSLVLLLSVCGTTTASDLPWDSWSIEYAVDGAVSQSSSSTVDVPDLVAVAGHLFQYKINTGTLGSSQLHFQAREAGRSKLPSWLSLSSTSGIFTGVPLMENKGKSYITLDTYISKGGASVAVSESLFSIHVVPSNAGKKQSVLESQSILLETSNCSENFHLSIGTIPTISSCPNGSLPVIANLLTYPSVRELSGSTRTHILNSLSESLGICPDSLTVDDLGTSGKDRMKLLSQLAERGIIEYLESTSTLFFKLSCSGTLYRNKPIDSVLHNLHQYIFKHPQTLYNGETISYMMWFVSRGPEVLEKSDVMVTPRSRSRREVTDLEEGPIIEVTTASPQIVSSSSSSFGRSTSSLEQARGSSSATVDDGRSVLPTSDHPTSISTTNTLSVSKVSNVPEASSSVVSDLLSSSLHLLPSSRVVPSHTVTASTALQISNSADIDTLLSSRIIVPSSRVIPSSEPTPLLLTPSSIPTIHQPQIQPTSTGSLASSQLGPEMAVSSIPVLSLMFSVQSALTSLPVFTDIPTLTLSPSPSHMFTVQSSIDDLITPTPTTSLPVSSLTIFVSSSEVLLVPETSMLTLSPSPSLSPTLTTQLMTGSLQLPGFSSDILLPDVSTLVFLTPGVSMEPTSSVPTQSLSTQLVPVPTTTTLEPSTNVLMPESSFGVLESSELLTHTVEPTPSLTSGLLTTRVTETAVSSSSLVQMSSNNILMPMSSSELSLSISVFTPTPVPSLSPTDSSSLDLFPMSSPTLSSVATPALSVSSISEIFTSSMVDVFTSSMAEMFPETSSVPVVSLTASSVETVITMPLSSSSQLTLFPEPTTTSLFSTQPISASPPLSLPTATDSSQVPLTSSRLSTSSTTFEFSTSFNVITGLPTIEPTLTISSSASQSVSLGIVQTTSLPQPSLSSATPSSVPVSTLPSPVPVSTVPSPVSVSTLPSPVPVSTVPSPVPVSSVPSPVPVSTVPSPVPVSTVPSPVPVSTLPSPVPVSTVPSPVSVSTLPSPVPVSTVPSPVPVSTLPSPVPVSTVPSPVPVSTLPSPVPVSTVPSPVSVSTLPSPVPVSTVPSPVPVSTLPSPVPVSTVPSPVPVSTLPSPTPSPSLPTSLAPSLSPTPSVTFCETHDIDCGNGTCLNESFIDLTAMSFCTCFPDYTGKDCTDIIDDCALFPCFETRTHECNDGNGTFTCECQGGYTGELCEEEINGCLSFPCLNADATCVDMGLGEFVCLCPSGYSGVLCETDIDPCDPNPCQSNETCVNLTAQNYTCDVPFSFSVVASTPTVTVSRSISPSLTVSSSNFSMPSDTSSTSETTTIITSLQTSSRATTSSVMTSSVITSSAVISTTPLPSPTLTPSPPVSNVGPVLLNPIGTLIVNRGQIFQFPIAEDTFSDEESGTTSSLSLTLLNFRGDELPNTTWVQVSGGNIEGLPLSSEITNEAITDHLFVLQAKDDVGSAAHDFVTIRVLPLGPFSSLLTVLFENEFETLNKNLSQKINLVQRLSSSSITSSTLTKRQLGVSSQTYNPEEIFVREIFDTSPLAVSYKNLTIADLNCAEFFSWIEGIYNFTSDEYTSRFVEAMAPDFLPTPTPTVEGICSLTSSNIPPIITEEVNVSDEDISHRYILLSTLVPVACIALCCLLLGLCALCLYRRTRSERKYCTSRRLYLNRRPIILEGETDFPDRRGRPVILENELALESDSDEEDEISNASSDFFIVPPAEGERERLVRDASAPPPNYRLPPMYTHGQFYDYLHDRL